MALIFIFICARLRSTSARLPSVSARLPPVSRWIASVMTKNWNSGVPSLSAVTWSDSSIVRPIRMRSTAALNSSPTGPGTSLATTPSVSATGRPERKPRTSNSMPSGNFALNWVIRRLTK
jgi:hypothetical protein